MTDSSENSAPAPAAAPTEKKPSGWLNMLVDYGPVLVFFVSYRMLRPDGGENAVGEVLAITKSTLAFMAATIVALVFSKWRFGKVSPMLWVSTVLVIGFGLLTVWSQDEFWIRHKPTAVYLLFSAVLFFGLLRGKPTLKILLESAFEGLSDEGWMKLTRNWAIFFIVLAGVNEVFAYREWFTFDEWLKAKLVVFLPLSLIFTFAHMPMLLRHGLAAEAKDDVAGHPPHE